MGKLIISEKRMKASLYLISHAKNGSERETEELKLRRKQKCSKSYDPVTS